MPVVCIQKKRVRWQLELLKRIPDGNLASGVLPPHWFMLPQQTRGVGQV